MNPRTTGLLLLAALGLGAFLYFYEIKGEAGRLEAEQASKRLFPDVEAADVSWIALRTSDGADARFELRDGKWQIVAPISFPADPAVERMAEALATVTSEATFENPQPDAEYGLDDAQANIVRFGANGVEHALRFGKSTPVGSNVYARAGEGGGVHTVAGYRAAVFTRALAELRDKQILSFDPGSIRTVEASWPGGRVALTREAVAPDADEGKLEPEPEASGGWKMTEPLAARADGEAIDGLLSTLSFLRADGFVDAPSDAQRALLSPPDFEVTLRSDDAQTAPLALAIGRPSQDEKRLVRAGGDVLYEIAATRISDFPRKPAAYRERHLATFAATEAQQLDFFFHSPDGDPVAIRAERSGDAGWTSSPEPFASDQLASVVSELSQLEASDILAESMSEKELEKLGLSPPITIVTVLGPAPAAPADAAKDEEAGEPLPPAPPRLAEVHFGNVTPGGVAARAAGNPIVYRLDLETAQRLPVNLEAFRTRFREQEVAPAPAEPPTLPGLAPPPPAEDSP